MMHSGFISFLVTGNPFPDVELAEVRAEVSFTEAINGHLAWRQCLIDSVLDNTDKPLPCLEMCDESACLLGRWLDGAGRQRYGDLPSFAELRAQHARFHQIACEVVELKATGRLEEAKRTVANDFLDLSAEIIARMKRLHELFGS